MNTARHDARRSQRRLRLFVLQFVPFASLILINVLFLAMLDTLFANKKRALILDSRVEFAEIKDEVAPIHAQLNLILKTHRDAYLEKAKEYLDNYANTFLEKEHPWFGIILEDENQNVVAQYINKDKQNEYNDWTNCLFSRDFQAPMVSSDFRITLMYASPKGWKSIETMVAQYWLFAVFFISATGLVYLWLYRNVLYPLLRIGSSMQQMARPGAVCLIQKPQHDIEHAFNHLARLQREVYFGFEIEQLAGRLQDRADDAEVVDEFLRGAGASIGNVYPFQTVEPFHFDNADAIFTPVSSDAIETPQPFDNFTPRWIQANCVEIPLRIGERFAGCLRCAIDLPDSLPQSEWEQIAQEIQKQSENGLARAFARSQALVEERNRFGINLATNMGHDLTNIVATGKWDLDTIQRAQSMGIVQLNPERGSFFVEAIDGLKNNLYFLQEMVNIYRSFGYARRPRYEEIDLSELVSDLAGLFRLSTSREFELDAHTPGATPAMIEPRLLRMALFNLLANSSQAIARSGVKGKIDIHLEPNGAESVKISIFDNGPGLRHADGNLMTSEEAKRVFQSGFSTKEGSSGGGLGLAWVKSIVEEFHHGRIQAMNRPEGGACISFTIPRTREEED
ncbi:MAG: HAMP domain-containing sensor histidine kinase [Candidatus Hinthialibacter antarcticus]|nr:HAMP domain-containing sensor histidine kinase [Candidatus Hinthialibacter antarcticus]